MNSSASDSSDALDGTDGPDTPAEPRRIDVHYHYMPPAWLGEPEVDRDLAASVRPIADAWTPLVALEEMDRNAVQAVVTSVTSPGVWFGDLEQSRRLSRACNEYGAQLTADHPGRFYSLTALPLPDVDAALAEIAFGLDHLGALGVTVFTSYDGLWVADNHFSPVWEELNRRHAVVFVHPTAPKDGPRLPGIASLLWEFPSDTGRVMLQWVASGASEKYPNVKLIFSHAGAAFLAGLGRLKVLAATRPELGLPADLADRVARFYFELSSSTDDVTLGVLAGHADAAHLLLGTDSPFIGPMGATIDQLDRQDLAPAVRAGIEHRNAEVLFGIGR
jgi:predicted TIM-barrel fold metal-dependent hydrolase